MGSLHHAEYELDEFGDELLTGFCKDEDPDDRNQDSKPDEDDDGSESDRFDSEYEWETGEGRLSKALQTWMPEHVITCIEPLEKPPKEPVFTGNLGNEPILERSSSTESITTQLSLFSCSTRSDRSCLLSSRRRRRRRRTRPPDNYVPPNLTEETESKWVRLANRRQGLFDKMMKAQQVMASDMYGNELDESEAFRLMDKDEQLMLFKTGSRRGIRYNKELRKSDSMANLVFNVPLSSRRTLSASAQKPFGKPINLEEIKRQMMNQKIAMLQKQNRELRKSARRRSLSRTSKHSTSSLTSELEPNIQSERPKTPEKQVLVWRGDHEILLIDLNRGLTAKVKSKIQSTTSALQHVTGYGELNERQIVHGALEEFPNYIEEDYALIPKISQRIRISPHLSTVIQEDMKVRMGRPRYHEIRIRDLEAWNRGQQLNRAHRNLKVFNWLHSLREADFEKDLEPYINDNIPRETERIDFLHVESADEPDLKPLYA